MFVECFWKLGFLKVFGTQNSVFRMACFGPSVFFLQMVGGRYSPSVLGGGWGERQHGTLECVFRVRAECGQGGLGHGWIYDSTGCGRERRAGAGQLSYLHEMLLLSCTFSS